MDYKLFEKEKAQPHKVLKRIKYKSGTPDKRYVEPGETVPDFKHLDNAGYAALRKARRITPVVKDGK